MAVVFCGCCDRLRTFAPRRDSLLTVDAGDGDAGYISSLSLLRLAHLPPQGGRLFGWRVLAHDSARCRAPGRALRCRLLALLGALHIAGECGGDRLGCSPGAGLPLGTALAGSTTVCWAAAIVLAAESAALINQGLLSGGMGSPVFGMLPPTAGAFSRLAEKCLSSR